MTATVSQRAALSHALAGGLAVHEFDPHGRAAAEVRSLWNEVKALTNGRA
jgi:chromosome partitioning protein